MRSNKKRSYTIEEKKEENRNLNQRNSLQNKNIIKNLFNLQKLVKKESILKNLCKYFNIISL